MSVFGPVVTGLIDISEDDDLSAAIDLDPSHEWQGFDFVKIMIPAMTAANLSLMGCLSIDGTFADIAASESIPVTTSARADTLKLGGFRFIKIKTSVAQAADRTFSLQGEKV